MDGCCHKLSFIIMFVDGRMWLDRSRRNRCSCRYGIFPSSAPSGDRTTPIIEHGLDVFAAAPVVPPGCVWRMRRSYLEQGKGSEDSGISLWIRQRQYERCITVSVHLELVFRPLPLARPSSSLTVVPDENQNETLVTYRAHKSLPFVR